MFHQSNNHISILLLWWLGIKIYIESYLCSLLNIFLDSIADTELVMKKSIQENGEETTTRTPTPKTTHRHTRTSIASCHQLELGTPAKGRGNITFIINTSHRARHHTSHITTSFDRVKHPLITQTFPSFRTYRRLVPVLRLSRLPQDNHWATQDTQIYKRKCKNSKKMEKINLLTSF